MEPDLPTIQYRVLRQSLTRAGSRLLQLQPGPHCRLLGPRSNGLIANPTVAQNTGISHRLTSVAHRRFPQSIEVSTDRAAATAEISARQAFLEDSH